MICLYNKTETNFTYNGLGTLEPTECSFFPSINGVWTLKMTLPVDPEGKSNLIENDKILKVTDIDCIEEQTSDYQLFRIYDFRKEQNYVYVNALPVGLDARFDTYVPSLKLYNKTATGALSDINNISNKYTVSGSGYDSTLNSAEFENANIISILNGEDSFVTRWDGEICYDNYNLKVNHRLGTNSTPLDVRYGKNIMGMSYDLDASNVITRLYPKAKSGEILNALGDYAIGQYPYVDAENASDYPIPHIYYCDAPYSLVQLSNDGSREYEKSIELYDGIKWLTAGWLHDALLEDNIYDGLLNEIELDWIINNYALTMSNDGVIGIVEYMARKIWTNDYHNILSETVRNLIFNAMKAGFDEVLKNNESQFYIGSASKSILNDGFGDFYSYTWDTDGNYRVNKDAEQDDYVWIYANSNWRQVNDQGYLSGTTDSATWKWYKKKGKSYKLYGNKKKNRKLHNQWWKINDVWYWFTSGGEGKKGAWLNNTYYEYFDDAEIDYGGSSRTLYEILLQICIEGEADLFDLLYRQMTAHCYYLYETDKLSFPSIKLEINMVDLSRTEEYKDFEGLERIHLGNEVRVYNPRLMPEPSTVRVIGLTYDVLRKCNTEISIGITESSVINLLNSIGQDKETKYVAGEGITIENNVIKVNPPDTPYLEDVIVNGASVVRNHKAYLDLDEMGIDETIDVLYGEEAPDDETDGEDKDFYLITNESNGIITADDYIAHSTTAHPITLDSFEGIGINEFNFVISGKPWNNGEGEELTFPLHNLIDGETYTLSFDLQESGNLRWYGDHAHDLIKIGDYEINFQKNTNKNHYEFEFVYSENEVMKILFYAIEDNLTYTATFTDFIIEGRFLTDKIIEIYNKKTGKWLKYTPAEMKGATSTANGESGSVPAPTIADKDKVLKGDGTWGTAGTEVIANPSETPHISLDAVKIDGTTYAIPYTQLLDALLDVQIYALGDREGLRFNATDQMWENMHITDVEANPSENATFTLNKLKVDGYVYNVPSGGGGSSSVVYDATEKVIGTWFGETLYEKTICTNFTSGQRNCYVEFTGCNIKTLVDFEGLLEEEVTVPFGLRGIIGTSSTLTITSRHQYGSYGYIDDTGVTVTRANTGNYLPNSPVRITIRYTKQS